MPKYLEPCRQYGRIRFQNGSSWWRFVIFGEAVLLFTLGSRASAHVYEVQPDGEAVFVGERDSNLAPRPVEAKHVAQDVVELLYGWNSSTVAET